MQVGSHHQAGDSDKQRNLAWVFVSPAVLPPTNLPLQVSAQGRLGSPVG